MTDGAGDRGEKGPTPERGDAGAPAIPRGRPRPRGGDGRRSARRLVTLGLLLAVALAKLGFRPDPVGHHSVDGSFYVQVARHVAAGEGLLTRASLYHQGLRELPHWSAIYPLWPLLLGGAGRVIGLESASVVLPPALALVALALYGALCDRLARRFADHGDAVPGTRGVLTVGHLAILLLALNPVFFLHTSLPYSEALGFALCFAALIALDAAGGKAAQAAGEEQAGTAGTGAILAWAALAGALASLAYLARSQLVGVVVAVPAALGFPALRERRYLAASALALAAAITLLAPWLVFLGRHAGTIAPAMLLDFTAFRETPELPPFALTVPTAGWLDFALDRASGLLVAFDPGHPNSYVQSFGAAAYLPLLALAGLLFRPSEIAAASRSATDPSTVGAIGVLIASAGCLAGVHLLHGTIIWPWWFHWRHGLPLALPIGLALGWLVARGSRGLRAAALAGVALSIVTGGAASWSLLGDPRLVPHGPAPDEQALIDWIDGSAPAPVLVTTHPQVLAGWTRQGGFHWIGCDDDPEQLTALLHLLPIDGAIVYPGEERCRAFASLANGDLPADLRFGRIALWRNPLRPAR